MPLSSKVIKQTEESLEEMPIRNKKIFKENQSFRDEGKVDEVKDAQRQASFILSNAHETVSSLIDATSKEMEKLKKEAKQAGYDQGYADGFNKGEDDAWEKASEDTADIYANAREILKQAKKIEESIYEESESEILDLCVEMSEKIISKQIDLNPETIIDIVKESCQQKIESKQFIVYVSPREVEIIRENKNKMASQLDSSAKIQIIADNSIEPGGCYLEHEEGYVDASLKTKLENLGFAVRSDE